MTSNQILPSLELWGGIECTVNRVGDQCFDQIVRSGHESRIEDLERFAELGIRALRYPVLWERTAPDGIERADWSWADERLAYLRDREIRPIVGLVHHGSGPYSTHLLDPGFAAGLARFARAVAERYPWVEDYTPINEPLTTARFSGLYGHWHPHGRSDREFLRALLTECHATRLAMKAIREVNPAARLIQTEDLGQISSTPLLSYQADFENERRWLTFDLLTGRVDTAHPIWSYLQYHGLTEADIAPFQEDPCPPDVMGFNYYLTSERFLDERVERYHPTTHGGNGREAYADVEAVRVLASGVTGSVGLMRQAWERYGTPLAITEVHLGCTREEQLRWLYDAWREANAARADGVDIRAVTVWSLLGAYDWNSLVTQDAGFYEPGAFDLRAPHPRPTAITGLMRSLAAGEAPTHPLLEIPGWWQRADRLLYPPYPSAAHVVAQPVPASVPPLLITGTDALVTTDLARSCDTRAIPFDLARHATASEIRRLRPWAVIVADRYDAPPATGTARLDALAEIARTCAEAACPLLVLSTDRVFEPSGERAYVESDPVNAADPAGRRWIAAEATILREHPEAFIVRTGPRLGGGWATDDEGAADDRSATSQSNLSAVHVPDLVEAMLDLLIDGERGIWHLTHTTGPDSVPPPLMGRRRTLASERGWPLPSLDTALPRPDALAAE